MNKKVCGSGAEDIAAQWLQEKGLHIVDRNRTMRGGELDIVGYLDDLLVVVEVRCIDHIDDLYGYMSAIKKQHLLRSTKHRIHLHHRTGPVSIDVVYVKGTKVVEWFQNITNA